MSTARQQASKISEAMQASISSHSHINRTTALFRIMDWWQTRLHWYYAWAKWNVSIIVLFHVTGERRWA
jgi:hypothetical protein